jgi:hypothetical protein
VAAPRSSPVRAGAIHSSRAPGRHTEPAPLATIDERRPSFDPPLALARIEAVSNLVEAVGLEPTPSRLRAGCSAFELRLMIGVTVRTRTGTPAFTARCSGPLSYGHRKLARCEGVEPSSAGFGIPGPRRRAPCVVSVYSFVSLWLGAQGSNLDLRGQSPARFRLRQPPAELVDRRGIEPRGTRCAAGVTVRLVSITN